MKLKLLILGGALVVGGMWVLLWSLHPSSAAPLRAIAVGPNAYYRPISHDLWHHETYGVKLTLEEAADKLASLSAKKWTRRHEVAQTQGELMLWREREMFESPDKDEVIEIDLSDQGQTIVIYRHKTSGLENAWVSTLQLLMGDEPQ